MTVEKQQGRVTAFDLGNARGVVRYGSNQKAAFLAGSFDAGRPPRYPREGDIVEVAVSKPAGKVLWIRLK